MGSDGMMDPVKIQTQERKQEAKNSAAGIAHKDPCWWKIEEQKTEAGAQKAPGNCHANRRGSGRVQHDVPEAGNRHDSGREPIGAVEKVESVYKQHEK